MTQLTARLQNEQPRLFSDVATLLGSASTYTAGSNNTVTAGQIIQTQAEGFAYQVAPEAATDQHVTTAGGAKLYVLPVPRGFNVQAFGAIGDGIANDTNAIQRALDHAKAIGGGIVHGSPDRFYRVERAGTYTGGRGFCIRIGANTSLEDMRITYNRAATTTELLISDVVGDLNSLVTENVAIRRVTIDGDSDTVIAGNGFNIRMIAIKNLILDQVRSIDATNWGVRIEQCDGVYVSGYSSDHGPDVNADGFHYIDCRNVSHVGGNIYTEGDDAFIIEAANFDIWNYNVAGITVSAPTGGISAGRGVLILRDTNVGTTVRNIENIKISASARNCFGAGLVISGGAANITNCNFDIVADNCSSAAILLAGDGVASGAISGCRFNIVGSDLTQEGFVSLALSGGVLEDNVGNVFIYNPGNDFRGISIRGNRWSGSFICDYNPRGTKTLFSLGVDILTTESSFFAQCEDAGTNIYVRDTSSQNTITLGHIRGGTVNDVELLGTGASTLFVGGFVAGTVAGATSATRFVGTVNQNSLIVRGEAGLAAQTSDKSSDATGLVTEFFRANSGTRPDIAFNWHTAMISRALNESGAQIAVAEGANTNRARLAFRQRSGSGIWAAWAEAQPVLSGTTAARPTTGLIPGLMVFDTTLGRPIWRNAGNTGWVDATGSSV